MRETPTPSADDQLIVAQEKLERKLRDRRIPAFSRLLYGAMYQGMRNPTLEDFEQLMAQLDAARARKHQVAERLSA